MPWLALAVLKSLCLSSVCYAKLGPSGGESCTHDTCARINIFGINNGSWGI